MTGRTVDPAPVLSSAREGARVPDDASRTSSPVPSDLGAQAGSCHRPGAGAARDSASFRDPDGFVYRREGVLYRQVNSRFAGTYRTLTEQKLFDRLIRDGLLIPHEEAPLDRAYSADAAAVLRPHPLPYISYPHEWSFGALRDAALLTLDIQERILDAGFVLKDASAFNVQFIGSAPIFIDSLSFALYSEGKPWAPYRQFCMHFLAPLALMSYRDLRCADLLRAHLEGIPLDLCAKLLPFRTKLSPRLASHIHLHSKFESSGGAGRSASSQRLKVSKSGLRGLLGSLRNTVSALPMPLEHTRWGGYEPEESYSAAAVEAKEQTVKAALDQVSPRQVWDIGANRGRFSRIAAGAGAYVVSFDVDPMCVEQSYAHAKRERRRDLLSLRLDATNPTGRSGWAAGERMSVSDRGPADLVLALALIHHLAISHHITFEQLSGWLAEIGKAVLLEFVPIDDPQSRSILGDRAANFDWYNAARLEDALRERFTIRSCTALPESSRTLYLLERRPG